MAVVTRDQANLGPTNDNSKPNIGILDLPREIRDKIYSELLIYPDFVFLDCLHLHETSNHDWHTWTIGLPKASLGILRLNKEIHQEATTILYGANCFFVDNVDVFRQFLDQIGRPKARLLRHLVIPFPDFHNDSHRISITLQDNCKGVQALNLIQERCQHLTTLETSLSSTHAAELRLDECDSLRAD
uniref:F-box domain-containing protein n=1 Tax=Bionectria ochroleuca TaxID=29856 RepID=A0A0B7KL15_BIOOC